MACKHEAWEMDAATADGYCPICLAAKVNALLAPYADAPYKNCVSEEPLDSIRVNECESDLISLSTHRFRRLWNEIVVLRGALTAIRDRAHDPERRDAEAALRDILTTANAWLERA